MATQIEQHPAVDRNRWFPGQFVSGMPASQSGQTPSAQRLPIAVFRNGRVPAQACIDRAKRFHGGHRAHGKRNPPAARTICAALEADAGSAGQSIPWALGETPHGRQPLRNLSWLRRNWRRLPDSPEYSMRTISPLHRAALVLALFGSLAGEAGAITLTREFTGSWYDPAHSGHGFNFEVVGSGANKIMLGYWYTYDAAGKPTWVIGTGPVTGNSAQLTAWTNSGGAFGNSFDPHNVQTIPWGTLTVSFSSCNQGTLQFNPGNPALASGSMPISRLTMLYNSSCTGGISGDTNATSLSGEIVQFMDNTGLVPAAQGKMKFDETVARSEFSVEAEDLPAGAYTLFVDNVARGTINVVSEIGGTNGELEFRSPVEPGKVLLDFDPRGKFVKIVRGSSVFLSATLGTTGTSTPPGGTGSGSPPFGNAEYRLSVEPSGNNGPELKARLEQRANRVDFNVELEDLPVGNYGLVIGGVDHGSISVRAVAGGTEGEIEFRNPPEPGHARLDFDPRGQHIDITSGGSVVISGLFPTTPGASGNGGGTSGGGNSGGQGGDDHGGGDDDGDGDDHGGG